METLSTQTTYDAICRCFALTSSYDPCHHVLMLVDDEFVQEMATFFYFLGEINKGELFDIPDNVQWNYFLQASMCNSIGCFKKGNLYCDKAIEQATGKIYNFLAPLAYLLKAQLQRNKFQEANDILDSLEKMLSKEENQLSDYYLLLIKCQRIYIENYQAIENKSIERYAELEDLILKFEKGDYLLVLPMMIAIMEYAISACQQYNKLYTEKNIQAFKDAAEYELNNAICASQVCKDTIKEYQIKPSHKLYAYYYQVKFKIYNNEEKAIKMLEKFPIGNINTIYQILALREPLATLRRKIKNADFSQIYQQLEDLQERLNEYDAPKAKALYIRELAIHEYNQRDIKSIVGFVHKSIKVAYKEPGCLKQVGQQFIKDTWRIAGGFFGFLKPENDLLGISNESKLELQRQKQQLYDTTYKFSPQEEEKEKALFNNSSNDQSSSLLSGDGNNIGSSNSGQKEETISTVQILTQPLNNFNDDGSGDNFLNEILDDDNIESEEKEQIILQLMNSGNLSSADAMNQTVNNISYDDFN